MPTLKQLLMGLCLIGLVMIIKPTSQATLLDTQGNPNKELLSLLTDLNIEHDGTLESIVKATQKAQPDGFMRAAGKERWELESFYDDQGKKIMGYAKQFNMLNTINPENTQYDYVVMLGATYARVKSRLDILKKAQQHGVRWDKLILLTGSRPLQPFEKEKIDAETEADMMKAVFDQAGLEYELVACPMKADGSRPTTLDTIQAWLAQKPQPGFIIAISNQPYVIYQDAVLRSQLPADFTLETVGHSAGGTTPELVLDTIARTLYIELMHAKEMR